MVSRREAEDRATRRKTGRTFMLTTKHSVRAASGERLPPTRPLPALCTAHLPVPPHPSPSCFSLAGGSRDLGSERNLVPSTQREQRLVLLLFPVVVRGRAPPLARRLSSLFGTIRVSEMEVCGRQMKPLQVHSPGM